MTLRTILRRQKRSLKGRRWTVRQTEEGKISEVKMIFNPDEYATQSNTKPMYTDKKLLKLLDKDYEKFTRDK